MTIHFFIPGIPRPGGSKTAFYVKSLGRAVLTDASGTKGKHWRQDVAAAGRQVYTGPLLEGPLSLVVRFSFIRPKSHMRKDGTLTKNAPTHHIQRPDTTKLLRSLEDALTGIIWRNDSQVVAQQAEKCWTFDPRDAGALVTVTTVD